VGSLGGVVPFIVIIAVFWFLFIRPQMRRQREARDMQSQLSVGDHVILTSGIYGEVAGITANDVLVKFSDDVVVRLTRGAIGHVLSPEVVAEKAAELDAADAEHDENAAMLFGDEGASEPDTQSETGPGSPAGEEK